MRSDPSATRRRLNDIRHHIRLAQHFLGGLGSDQFRDDILRFYAVTRCLEIISEASRRLPDEITARHPSIGWKEMAGAGNVYRHDYEDVAARRVWNTVHRALPPLLVVVETELAILDSG